MGAFLLHLVGIFDLTTLVKEYPCLGVFERKNGSQDGWRWWMGDLLEKMVSFFFKQYPKKRIGMIFV